MDFVFTQLKTLLKKDEYLLSNLLIPFKSGFKDKIDAVLISRKGVISIKLFFNTADRVKGNDEDAVWITSNRDVEQRPKIVPNPVLQNKLHAEIIRQALVNNYKVANIVILQDVWNVEEVHSTHAFTFAEYSSIYEEMPDALSIEEIQNIWKILKVFTRK